MQSRPRHTRSFVAAALLGLIVAACGGGPAGDSTDATTSVSDSSTPISDAQLRTEVQQAVTAYADALTRADVGPLLALYARGDSISSIDDGVVTRGWDGVRADADSTLIGLRGRFAGAVSPADITLLGARHALVVLPYTVDIDTPRGPAQMRGAMSLVLRRADAGWLVVHDHSSMRADITR